ncbi:Uncharacterised protein [Vibrio cholerae]|nr:Uncharacterised protein [Vibrio cholerae]
MSASAISPTERQPEADFSSCFLMLPWWSRILI